MDALLPGLHASPPEPLGFAPHLGIRAFLLQRELGNVLIYRSAALQGDGEAEAIDALGGVGRQYLNHSYEASPACDWVRDRFDAPLLVHGDDAEQSAAHCTVDHTFTRRHRLDDDLEVIPTPGHTPGATAYLWDGGGHRVLFTGDTVYFPREGDWRAAVLDGVSDRDRYVESLELLRDLDFDVLLPGIARLGEPYHAVVEDGEGRRRIGEILERVRRGEDG